MKGLQAALENAPSALAARSVLEGFDIATRYQTSFSSHVPAKLTRLVNKGRTDAAVGQLSKAPRCN